MKIKVIYYVLVYRICLKDYAEYLHCILSLCYEGAFGDEGKKPPLPGMRKGNNEEHKKSHFSHKEGKDLRKRLLAWVQF